MEVRFSVGQSHAGRVDPLGCRHGWFQYTSPETYLGSDVITVTGRDTEGVERQGLFTIVIEGSPIQIRAEAVPRGDLIEFSLSTEGKRTVDSFDLVIAYDPAVVRPIETTFGSQYPDLHRSQVNYAGSLSVGAHRAFVGGTDLFSVQFERIAPGQADIRVSSTSWRVNVGGQELSPSAVEIEYIAYDPLDTNRDGRVSAIDALNVINSISRWASGGEPDAAQFLLMDANGDGRVSGLDALLVINRLAKQFDIGLQGEGVSRTGVYSEIDSVFADASSFAVRRGVPDDDQLLF